MTADPHKEFRITIRVADSVLGEEDSTPANPQYGIHASWAERLFKFPVLYGISNLPDSSSFMHRASVCLTVPRYRLLRLCLGLYDDAAPALNFDVQAVPI